MMYRSIFALIALVSVLAGCAARQQSNLIAGTGEAQIIVEDSTSTPTMVINPPAWASRTLKAQATVPLANGAINSPGIASASAKLAAADKARHQLIEQIGSLEASRGTTVAALAESQPMLRTAIFSAVESSPLKYEPDWERKEFTASTEFKLRDTAQLVVEANKELAAAKQRQKAPLDFQRDAVIRAQRQALERARDDLRRQILQSKHGRRTIAELIETDKQVQRHLDQAIRNSRPKSSAPTPAGQWRIEVQADLAEMNQYLKNR